MDDFTHLPAATKLGIDGCDSEVIESNNRKLVAWLVKIFKGTSITPSLTEAFMIDDR